MNLIMYFLKRKRKLKAVPRQYIQNHYDVREATDEQLNLMVAGKARTPKEAQRLLDKYQTKYASVVIDFMPVRKRTFWQIFDDRLHTLFNRLEGSSRYNPVYKRGKAMNLDAMTTSYKFERTENE